MNKPIKKLSLSEKVQMSNLWNSLEKNLKEPFSKEDLANLATLESYLRRRYATQEPEFHLQHPDLNGNSVKTLDIMDETMVGRENRPEGPVFWIRFGDRDSLVCTDGRSVIEYPPLHDIPDDSVENYWTLREYDAKGNIKETTRCGDKMKTTHRKVGPTRHVAPRKAPLKKQATR